MLSLLKRIDCIGYTQAHLLELFIFEVNVQLYASGHNDWAESLFEVVYLGECVVVTHMQTD